MRVLIIGKRSYIGSNLKSHLEKHGCLADEADAENDEWKTVDYSAYDSVVHVAAIVHQNAKSADEALFNRVNTELPVEAARLAKSGGVSQFVFLSTMGVYGKNKSLKESDVIINAGTPENETSGYGGSKLRAEKILKTLETESFKVAVVRPPSVYGPGCKGNYIPLFKKLALLSWVFPFAFSDICQSMIYIDNLCELIRLIIEKKAGGLYLPQDDCAPSTVYLVHQIRDIFGKKTRYSKALGAVVRLCGGIQIVKKIYGGIQYDYSVSGCFDNKYQIVSFTDGLYATYKDSV